MATFSLTRLAKADLRSIAKYTEHKWGRSQRKHYLKGIDDTFSLLAKSPQLGANCDFIADTLRKYPFQSHIIYYQSAKKTTIQVVRVLHKRMDVGGASFSS